MIKRKFARDLSLTLTMFASLTAIMILLDASSLFAGDWVFNPDSSLRFTAPQKFRESYNYLAFMKEVLSFEEVTKSILECGVKETILSLFDFAPPRTVYPSDAPRFKEAAAMLVIDVGKPETAVGATTLVNLKETTLPAGGEAFDMLANTPAYERDDEGRLVLDENLEPKPVAVAPPSVPPLQKYTGIAE